VTGAHPASPVTQYGITGHAAKFVQPYFSSLDPRTFLMSGGRVDPWLSAYTTANREVNRRMLQQSSKNWTGSGNNRVAASTLATTGGFQTAGVILDGAPVSFGSWSFNVLGLTNLFFPNPGRDFHPYWRYPYMPDVEVRDLWRYTAPLTLLACTSSQTNFSLRDPARQERWYGYALSQQYLTSTGTGPDGNTTLFQGAVLEKTVEEIGAEDPTKARFKLLDSADIPHLFDYERQDELDRYDIFRGVLSRAAYGDAKAPEDVGYNDDKRRRAASVQSVSPSGVYFLTLGTYSEYTLGRGDEKSTQPLHYTRDVTDWFDVRFRHEYLWYSQSYFPCTRAGGALYGQTRGEYTGVASNAAM